jgi:pimeloyl-ACP methyl ester carboxylesterase
MRKVGESVSASTAGTSVAQSAAPAHPRSRARRVLARLAIGLAVVLLVAYLGISVLAANILATPRRVFGAESPATLNLAFSDVSFPARGGDVQISAWFIPDQGSHKAIVLVHGKDSSRTGWIEGDWANFVPELHKHGFALLLIDMRGHGRSGDAHYSFGVNERRDVEGAVDWLKGQGFQPRSIGVLGISMGAASSILATAEDPDIAALVEDCGYAAIYPLIQQEWGKSSHLPDFFIPSTILTGRLMFGYDLGAARPVDEVGHIAPRPLLIIHGTDDGLIPLVHAEQLKAAAPAAELWEVPGAKHGGAYTTQPQQYLEKVTGFFDRSLK